MEEKSKVIFGNVMSDNAFVGKSGRNQRLL